MRKPRHTTVVYPPKYNSESYTLHPILLSILHPDRPSTEAKVMRVGFSVLSCPSFNLHEP